MNNTIIWYQSALLNDPDVIICNGEKLPKSSKRDEVFNQIWRTSQVFLSRKTPFCVISKDKCFIKGNFDAKDELDRTMGFMFVADKHKWKSELKKTLEVTGYSLDPETERCITKKKYKRHIIAGITIIAIYITYYSLTH